MVINKSFVKQLLLYGIIGGVSAALDVVVFSVLYNQLNINEFLANILSVHFGIALSFFLNSRYNFKKTDQIAKRAVSFYITGLLGIAISTGIIFVGNYFLLPVMAVKIVSVFIVAAIQFLINKFVTFRR